MVLREFDRIDIMKFSSTAQHDVFGEGYELEAEQRSCIDTSVQVQARELRWMDDKSPGKVVATCHANLMLANKSV